MPERLSQQISVAAPEKLKPPPVKATRYHEYMIITLNLLLSIILTSFVLSVVFDLF